MFHNYFSMEGKNVIFTGGSGFLGLPMVKALLENGAKVAVPSRNDKFDESFDEYRKNGQFIHLKYDLTIKENIKKCFKEIYDIWGKIDVLVNCAVKSNTVYQFEKIDDEMYSEMIDGSFGIVFRSTREILPYFDKNGGGVIVNIASMYGMIAPDFAIYGDNIPWNPPIYGSGKAAVLQFSRYCASALARRNIRVNCITPGPFPNIEKKETVDMAFIGRLSKKTMLNRTGRRDELVGAILLLCSDASSFMTGTNIVVDGGMTAW